MVAMLTIVQKGLEEEYMSFKKVTDKSRNANYSAERFRRYSSFQIIDDPVGVAMLTIVQKGLEALPRSGQCKGCCWVAMLTIVQKGLEALLHKKRKYWVPSRNANYSAERFRSHCWPVFWSCSRRRNANYSAERFRSRTEKHERATGGQSQC